MSRSKKPPADEPLILAPGFIEQKEAGARMNISAPTMTRLKQSGEVAGFYPEGVNWDEFCASYIEYRERKVAEKLKNGSVSQAEEFGKLAMARKRMRDDQIKAGVTLYLYDIIDAMDEVASGMRQAQAKLSRSMAVPMIQLFTEMLLRTMSTEDSIVVSRAMSGIDQAEVERFIQKIHDRNLGDLGERFREVLPKAIARAKESKG